MLIILIYSIQLFPKKYILSRNLTFLNHIDKHLKMKYLSNNSNIIIGDSRADFGLNDPKNLFENLSLRGSTPVEGYLTLMKVLNNNIKIDTLIISYGSVHINKQLTFYSLTKYFNLFNDDFSKRELINIESIPDPIYDDTNSWIHPLIPKTLYPFYFKVLDFTSSIFSLPYSLIKPYLNDNYEKNKINSDPYCLSQEIHRESLKSKSIVNEIYINKIFKTLRENKIKFFYVYPPVVKTSKLLDDKDYWNRYYEITKKFNPVNDVLTKYDFKLFRDCSHLNLEGEKLFSQKIFNKIRF